MREARALNYANAYLNEMRQLGSTKALDLSGGGDTPTATFSCRGYAAWLNYDYGYSNYGGEIDLSTKLGLALNADPNGFFSSANALITENTLQVCRCQPGVEAWTLINDLVALGDVNYNRYAFGVYFDRSCAYQQIPTTVSYYQYLSDSSGGILGLDQSLELPWSIRPGQWIRFASFLAGHQPTSDDPRNDPRCMFVEQVTYTAPYDLKLQGGQTDRLTQLMAQSGLSGG